MRVVQIHDLQFTQKIFDLHWFCTMEFFMFFYGPLWKLTIHCFPRKLIFLATKISSPSVCKLWTLLQWKLIGYLLHISPYMLASFACMHHLNQFPIKEQLLLLFTLIHFDMKLSQYKNVFAQMWVKNKAVSLFPRLQKLSCFITLNDAWNKAVFLWKLSL